MIRIRPPSSLITTARPILNFFLRGAGMTTCPLDETGTTFSIRSSDVKTDLMFYFREVYFKTAARLNRREVGSGCRAKGISYPTLVVSGTSYKVHACQTHVTNTYGASARNFFFQCRHPDQELLDGELLACQGDG